MDAIKIYENAEGKLERGKITLGELFLNNNSITKEEIISIITDGYGIALFYIAESEGVNENNN